MSETDVLEPNEHYLHRDVVDVVNVALNIEEKAETVYADYPYQRFTSGTTARKLGFRAVERLYAFAMGLNQMITHPQGREDETTDQEKEVAGRNQITLQAMKEQAQLIATGRDEYAQGS